MPLPPDLDRLLKAWVRLHYALDAPWEAWLAVGGPAMEDAARVALDESEEAFVAFREAVDTPAYRPAIEAWLAEGD